jgi:hypothetical protein
MGVMYAIAGEPKTMTFSGPTESRHPLTNSFRHSRVVVASAREFQRACYSEVTVLVEMRPFVFGYNMCGGLSPD